MLRTEKEAARRKAIKKGGKLLERHPELKSDAKVQLGYAYYSSDLEKLCELLKGNAIPTKILDLSGRENNNVDSLYIKCAYFDIIIDEKMRVIR